MPSKALLRPGQMLREDARVPGVREAVTGGPDVPAVLARRDQALLTQAGKYQANIACATIMNRDARAVWDGPLIPRVAFTEAQVASVGYTLAEALDEGIVARTP